MSLLRKNEKFRLSAAIPSTVSRRVAIALLHNHAAVIEVNPLVTSHRPIEPPATAASDEHYCSWYEIAERVQYVPGLGRIGAGAVKCTACFYDTSAGLQTHAYAPAGVDLKVKYLVAGLPTAQTLSGHCMTESHMSGQPPSPRQSDDLYLSADVEIECHITLLAFVRSQCKAAIKAMVERMVQEAAVQGATVPSNLPSPALTEISPQSGTSTTSNASEILLKPDVFVPKPTLPKINTTWTRPASMVPPPKPKSELPATAKRRSMVANVGNMTSGAVYSPSLYSPDCDYLTENLAHLHLPPKGAITKQVSAGSSPSHSPPITPPDAIELGTTGEVRTAPSQEFPIELPADEVTAKTPSPPPVVVAPRQRQRRQITSLPHPLRSNPPDSQPSPRPKHVSASFDIITQPTYGPVPQQKQQQQRQKCKPPRPDSAIVAPLQIQRRPRVKKNEIHPSPLRIGAVSKSGATGEDLWLDALDSSARGLRLMKPLPGLPSVSVV